MPLYFKGRDRKRCTVLGLQIELRCLTRYPAATARLVFHNTVSSRYRVDVRHPRCRPSNVWRLSVSFEAFNGNLFAFFSRVSMARSALVPHSAVWTRPLFVWHKSKFSRLPKPGSRAGGVGVFFSRRWRQHEQKPLSVNLGKTRQMENYIEVRWS